MYLIALRQIHLEYTCIYVGGVNDVSLLTVCSVCVCQDRLFVFERKQQPHLHEIILFMLSTPEQTDIYHSSIHSKRKPHQWDPIKRQYNNVFQFIPLTRTYPQLDTSWMEIGYCPPDLFFFFFLHHGLLWSSILCLPFSCRCVILFPKECDDEERMGMYL